ncbi:MAG: hypothetical protein WCY11_13065, partial [Novosphingobium sp.]
MNLSFTAQTDAARVGNLYGWAIGFLPTGGREETATLLLSSSDYHAKIDATLPEGLSGGRVSVVIDALTDDDYRKVRSCVAANLYLFWQDANADFAQFLGNSFGLAGLGGGPSETALAPALVMRFAYEARRRGSQRKYETVLEGRDFAFHRLSQRTAPRQCFASMAEALLAIGDMTDLTIMPEPTAATLLGQHLMAEDEQTDAASPGQTCAGALGTIAARIGSGSRGSPQIKALRRDAPPVVLLRNGGVHVGRRALPYPAGSSPKVLDPGNGLIDAARESSGSGDSAQRWTLTCRGRPDIKPGDIVQFRKPPEDVDATLPDVATALVGVLAGPIAGPIAGATPEPPDCSILVGEVAHAMSRTGGFSTRVAGRTVPMVLPIDPWSLFQTATGLEEGPVTTAIG